MKTSLDQIKREIEKENLRAIMANYKKKATFAQANKEQLEKRKRYGKSMRDSLQKGLILTETKLRDDNLPYFNGPDPEPQGKPSAYRNGAGHASRDDLAVAPKRIWTKRSAST